MSRPGFPKRRVYRLSSGHAAFHHLHVRNLSANCGVNSCHKILLLFSADYRDYVERRAYRWTHY